MSMYAKTELFSNDICDRCMKSRIWIYNKIGNLRHRVVYACLFCYVRNMRKSYTTMYLESWRDANYERIQINEKYCVIGGLVNLQKIQARIQYIGE
jgi:hypothetical protein